MMLAWSVHLKRYWLHLPLSNLDRGSKAIMVLSTSAIQGLREAIMWGRLTHNERPSAHSLVCRHKKSLCDFEDQRGQCCLCVS